MTINLQKAEELLKAARKLRYDYDNKIIGFLYYAETYDGISPHLFHSPDSKFYELNSKYKDTRMEDDVLAAFDYMYSRIAKELRGFPDVDVAPGHDSTIEVRYILPKAIQQLDLHQDDLEVLAKFILKRLQTQTKGDLSFEEFIIEEKYPLTN
ncbi:hypothetical protein N752_25140 [Desulforamulus aquiferis]|nr:hypothetical protein [Desulforamulus aquiferis]RYD02616.1 hypothetical protein N752_25140 [Desulforamulus aquiferis]